MKRCFFHHWKVSTKLVKAGRRSTDTGLSIQSLLCVKCGKMKVELIRNEPDER